MKQLFIGKIAVQKGESRAAKAYGSFPDGFAYFRSRTMATQLLPKRII